MPEWFHSIIQFLTDERSLALATWGLVIATFLLVIATLFLYSDGRTKSREQADRWAREDRFRIEEARPKAFVEIARTPADSTIHFRCFNLGSTTFLINNLILTTTEPKPDLYMKHEPEGPPIVLPGTVASVWFIPSALLCSDKSTVEVSAVFEVIGASGNASTEPVWFYCYPDPDQKFGVDWKVGRLRDRLPGAVVQNPRALREMQ